MNQPRSFTATRALALLASACAALGASSAAHAGRQAGTVINLNGPLLAKKADGVVKLLSLKSAVEEGDTLVTEKGTYARIRFVDNSEITLRPNSQLKIDSFVFEEASPEKDSAGFNLVKGGLRAVTGVLGKRNNERFSMNTPTATIGIRGTTFIAEYVAPNAAAVAAFGRAALAAAPGYGNALSVSDTRWNAAPLELLPMRLAQAPGAAAPPGPASRNGLAPGLYVQVVDGMILVQNQGGATGFQAGQFGFTPSVMQPPVILPANPGLHFTPPPAFSSSPVPQGAAGAGGEAGGVDCEVR